MRRQQQAERFVAWLYSGRMTDDDEQDLYRWLAQSEQNSQDYQAALAAWDSAEGLTDRVADFAPLSQSSFFSAHRAGLAIAAGVVLCVMTMFLFWARPDFWPFSAPEDTLGIYATNLGQQQTVHLSDGSTMILNTNTRVLIDFSDKRRRAVLEYGEAYFDVAAEGGRPFTVAAGPQSVTVLGTRFSVYKAGTDLDVGVVDGMVAVHRAEDIITPNTVAVQLKPGERQEGRAQADQYRIGAGVKVSFSGVIGTQTARLSTSIIPEMAKYPYWRGGQMRFDQQPLYQVVKEINRYTARKVLIEDKAVMDLPISGVFNVQEVESALDSFELALPIRITRFSDRIVIEGSRG